MARFYGVIGYESTEEVEPGVWESKWTERNYYGDLIRRSSRYQDTQKINEDINLSNEISIVADPYAFSHFSHIRYVCIYGEKWKVTNVELQRPRLILSVGGLFNAE